MYLVGGQRYEAGEHGLERALAAAHDGRIRPLCLCSDPPVPVYIARWGETFVLKRMPFTGSQHAVGCCHHEPPAELSGIGEVLEAAISEDRDTGVTQLRVGFAMSKRMPRTVGSSSDQDAGGVRNDGVGLSLRGLLHFLWHEAELTHWHPGFAGKRSWAVVRSHLLTAATNKYVRGVPLADALYVPESFSVANRDEIEARRMRRFANGLQRHGVARPLMLLIGEVKVIVPTHFHFKAVIKHVPDLAFLLDGQLHRRMMRHFERELSLWGGADAIRMILIATFALNEASLPAIEELALMPANLQWLPVEDRFEVQLVERLVNDRRVFEKTLRFNAWHAHRGRNAILLDGPNAPVALCIDRTDEERGSAYETVVSTNGASPQWFWRPYHSDVPPLPT